MLKTLFVGTAISLMAAGGALAQDAGGNAPNDFEIQDRAVFVNEDGSMKSGTEIQAGWEALTDERQEAIRVRCTELREVAKTNGHDDGSEQAGQTNATPGVYDAYTACNMVDAM